ncbi:sulfate anion transporter 1 [Mastacembelus armatus]|uniref:Sulfate transporter n=1 Tax=Mastacembelus armatus TaxID=205130 RepID=A0A3Q3RSN2_9TELE|nr:sulfate anion transporter 1-like [Mastacembelus armatus]XP_026153699.1 sulfate anion transporter 1-like [Mastacembelus armatus]XP_026153700.1 sulfate anion transporter 1-like [Mastacembelus armatus]XP_026153701.1 sulfate anion transporter 1-like [Mastacembelus armatus]XP_026153702.1 sulfate anion transporter 1-like [Mastacembelus armatus]XP_026153703.1 sulfate anion transporter 1-like [Mastacembelus armatus]XP_026153704.1 sulfate anion transporter 1-like [Mastacembelus armatus]XP_02615370
MEEVTETEPATTSLLLERRVHQRQPTASVIKSKLKQGVTCSVPRVRSTLTGFFPVLRWLPKYKLQEYIWGDLMSGMIVGIILVPQAIAYCLLAGVEPLYGLYTSFYANIIYFLMGTSKHVSVGIFSLMSLMVGQVVDRELFLAGFDLSEDPIASGPDKFNASVDTNITVGQLHSVDLMGLQCDKECYAISIAAALTLLAGVYQVIMAVFRLGFVSVYLSTPMLDGFATGASVTILTVQVKYLLGLKIPRHHGYSTVVVTWFNIFASIHKTNLCDFITSVICILILVAGKEIQERYKDRLKIPLPTELVVVAGATLASHFGELNTRYGSSVSGHIPTGFIPPRVPSFSLMPQVALDAIPLAVISFAFTVSLSEMFAKKNGYTVRPNQEMLAIGFCNIVPSFFHCFTTSAALAKTMVKDSTGCQTQVSSLISALVVLLVLLFFAPFFYALQKCVLACIIIISLRGALRKFKDVPAKWRNSRSDTIVWLVTMLATALISVELGLLVGISFSMICIIFKTQKPKVSLLGRATDTDLYEDVDEYKNLVPPPRVHVLRFQAPLYYANKDTFLKSIYKVVKVEPFLEITKRNKAQKKAKERYLKQAKGDKNNGQLTPELIQRELEFHTIVLDCSAIPFIDSTGVATFKGLFKEYKEIGVNILLASCNTSIIDTLKKGQFFGKNDKDMSSLLFHTVHAAVIHANSTYAAAQSRSEDSVV